MPIYVYECQKCERVIEVEQRISEDPLADCECGAVGRLKRIIQPTAVMFKGSGFYVNDSGSKTPKESSTSGAKSDVGSQDSAPPATTDSSS